MIHPPDMAASARPPVDCHAAWVTPYLMQELRRHNIKTMVIEPGFVATDMVRTGHVRMGRDNRCCCCCRRRRRWLLSLPAVAACCRCLLLADRRRLPPWRLQTSDKLLCASPNRPQVLPKGNLIPERCIQPQDIAEAAMLPLRMSANAVPLELVMKVVLSPYKSA